VHKVEPSSWVVLEEQDLGCKRGQVGRNQGQVVRNQGQVGRNQGPSSWVVLVERNFRAEDKQQVEW